MEKKKYHYSLLERIQNKFYQDNYLYKAQIMDYPVDPLEAFQLVPLNNEMLEAMIMDYPEEIPDQKQAIIRESLKEGSQKVYWISIDHENNIYGFIAIDYGQHTESMSGYDIPKEPDSVYLYDAYVFHSKRGHRITTFSIEELLRQAKAQGYKTAYTMILHNNRASEKSIEKFGFKKVKKIRQFVSSFKSGIEVKDL